MLWVYSYFNNVTTVVNMSFYNITDGTLYAQSLPAVGEWHNEYISATCGISRDINNNSEFRMLIILNNNYQMPILINLTDVVSAFNPGNSSTWVCS